MSASNVIKLGVHRGFGCTDHSFYQDKRDIPNLPVENTLAAMQKAFDAGADFIETDLVMSEDGVLFMLHNVVPDDHFFGNQKPAQLLNKMKFADITTYKTGRYHTGQVAKFSDVLELIAQSDPHSVPWAINVEIKGVQGSDQNYEENDFFEQIVAVVNASSLPVERILWSSFCLKNIIKASYLFPTSQFGMIFGEEDMRKPIFADHQTEAEYQYLPFHAAELKLVLDLWQKQANPQTHLDYIHPEIMAVSPLMIGIVADLSLSMNCWTYKEEVTPFRLLHYKDSVDQTTQLNVPLTIVTDYLIELQKL